MNTLYMLKVEQTKKQGTKTVWLTENSNCKLIPREDYNRIIESAPFFRSLGGTETLTRSYTKQGYLVTNLVSTSPDKQNRSIYTFLFDRVDFRLTFTARLIGAIGISSEYTELVNSDNFDNARIKLYEKYESIHLIKIEIKIGKNFYELEREDNNNE